MMLPTDAVIPRDKLLDYLLASRRKNDKSRYLAQAGFTRDNPEILDAALRRLIAEYEGVIDRVDDYGVFYRVAGPLQGPDGILPVVSIWMKQETDGVCRFVTLKPMR